MPSNDDVLDAYVRGACHAHRDCNRWFNADRWKAQSARACYNLTEEQQPQDPSAPVCAFCEPIPCAGLVHPNSEKPRTQYRCTDRCVTRQPTPPEPREPGVPSWQRVRRLLAALEDIREGRFPQAEDLSQRAADALKEFYGNA